MLAQQLPLEAIFCLQTSGAVLRCSHWTQNILLDRWQAWLFCSSLTKTLSSGQGAPSLWQSSQRLPWHKSPERKGAELGFHNALTHSRCHLITGNDCRSFSCGTSFSHDGICLPPTQRRRDKCSRLRRKYTVGGKIKSGACVGMNTQVHAYMQENWGIKKENRGAFNVVHTHLLKSLYTHTVGF